MNKRIPLIIAVIIVVSTDLYFASNQPRPSLRQTPPASGPITVSGEITCLPKLGPGPHTMECSVGLKGDDGKHYGLKNLFKQGGGYEYSTTGLRVEVSGTLNHEEIKGPDGNKYDVVGVIDVTSIKEIGN